MISTPSLADTRAILLDIEGTTTPIDFVHQVLFSYARSNVKSFLQQNWDSKEVVADREGLCKEHEKDLEQGQNPPLLATGLRDAQLDSLVEYINWLIDRELKAIRLKSKVPKPTALKSLEGKIWEQGYRNGSLKSQVFPDVAPALEHWRQAGLTINIFSSGSVLAQKLLFAHTEVGDLTGFISQYFDTAVGAKTDTESYYSIAKVLGISANQILFISDMTPELEAASGAGMNVVLCMRPGNQPQGTVDQYQRIQSFDEIYHEPPIDKNVLFTVYRPVTIVPMRWYPLLAFAHLSKRRPDAPKDEPDPVKEVQRQAARILSNQPTPYEPSKLDRGFTVPRKGFLTFVPLIEGCEFNPPSQSISWLKDVHKVEFEMRASTEVDGREVEGQTTVYLGSVILCEIPLRLNVDSRYEPPRSQKENFKAASAEPYRKIFASYSHSDTQIVEDFEDYIRSLGDQYLRDVKTLRSGEVWSEQLELLIGEADVFQLFWSSNSMTSPFVRQEWEYALSLNRDKFIRPVYWEEPLPEKKPDLPPATLRRFHFYKFPTTQTLVRDSPPTKIRPGPQPEIAPEGKPELRPEIRPEVRPEVGPELKPELRPEVRPEIQPEIAPEVKPEIRPEVRPEIQPEIAPEVKPEIRPEIRPEIKLERAHRGGFDIQQKLELIKALQNAFDPEGFDRMLAQRLDKKRHNVVSNQKFPEIVFQVIEAAEREGWTADLIRGALEANPGNPQLLDFVAGNPEYNPSIPQKQGQDIATLGRAPELLEKRLGFLRSSFELVLQNINVISDYKKLQDELHNLIFAVFPLVEDADRLLPEGKDARSNLAKHHKTLRIAIEEMREVAQRELVEAEESEWIDQLDLGRKELKAVLDDFDKENLETALQKIRDVLETQSTHVNKKLWLAMNSVNSRLPELIKILGEVLTYLKDDPPERREKFETGIESLKTLTAKLDPLMSEHDTWQEVVGQLPEIGDWIEADLSKFKTQWQEVRARIAPFYVGKSDEETAVDLEKADARVEQALRNAEDPRVTVPFDSSMFEDYRVKASRRFYDLNGILLEKFEYLRDIRNQLL